MNRSERKYFTFGLINWYAIRRELFQPLEDLPREYVILSIIYYLLREDPKQVFHIQDVANYYHGPFDTARTAIYRLAQESYLQAMPGRGGYYMLSIKGLDLYRRWLKYISDLDPGQE